MVLRYVESSGSMTVVFSNSRNNGVSDKSNRGRLEGGESHRLATFWGVQMRRGTALTVSVTTPMAEVETLAWQATQISYELI